MAIHQCRDCGAENQKRRYCNACGAYMGHRLGILRRSSLTLSNLPSVKSGKSFILSVKSESSLKDGRSSAIHLASLEQGHSAQSFRTSQGSDGVKNMENQSDTSSKQLEALLSRLDNSLEMPADGSAEFEIDVECPSKEFRFGPVHTELEDGFYLSGEGSEDEDEEISLGSDSHDSGPIPMGSGVYAVSHRGRIKDIFSDMLEKVGGGIEHIRLHGVSRGLKQNILLIVVALLFVVSLGYIISHVWGSGEESANASASEGVEEVAKVEDEGLVLVENSATEALKIVDDLEGKQVVEDKSAVVAVSDTKVDKRQFGPKDNMLLDSSVEGRLVGVKRVCIMREGPSSRFKLIKQVKSKEKIRVLLESEEDWELKEENGRVGWFKQCSGSQCKVKMGPGVGFKEIQVGQSVPKASSRVISSKGWRYVKSGEVYGWIGPACFK